VSEKAANINGRDT